MSRLDRQMEQVLKQPDLPADVKAQLFFQTLQRFLSFKSQLVLLPHPQLLKRKGGTRGMRAWKKKTSLWQWRTARCGGRLWIRSRGRQMMMMKTEEQPVSNVKTQSEPSGPLTAQQWWKIKSKPPEKLKWLPQFRLS